MLKPPRRLKYDCVEIITGISIKRNQFQEDPVPSERQTRFGANNRII